MKPIEHIDLTDEEREVVMPIAPRPGINAERLSDGSLLVVIQFSGPAFAIKRYVRARLLFETHRHDESEVTLAEEVATTLDAIRRQPAAHGGTLCAKCGGSGIVADEPGMRHQRIEWLTEQIEGAWRDLLGQEPGEFCRLVAERIAAADSYVEPMTREDRRWWESALTLAEHQRDEARGNG